MQMLSLIITILVLIYSAYTDLYHRKVYNYITFPAMIIGLVLCGFPLSGTSYYRILWLLVFFVLGQSRLMGMGDLKLCMAVIALRGIEETSLMLFMGAILLFLFCYRVDKKNTVLMLKDTYRTFLYHTPIIKRSKKKYPFAFFLAIGYIFALILRGVIYA